MTLITYCAIAGTEVTGQMPWHKLHTMYCATAGTEVKGQMPCCWSQNIKHNSKYNGIILHYACLASKITSTAIKTAK